MKSDRATFKTEAEMCGAFVEWLRRFPEWTPYAETAGWDLLLAHSDGTQVGIQAKLKFNLAVLEQALEKDFRWGVNRGPDFRAVLVPEARGSALCSALGLTLLHGGTTREGKVHFYPEFHDRAREGWHYCNPKERHPLPEYVPDVAAGAAAPCALTEWKIAALQICAIIELRGYVTREDFKLVGIDHRRWTAAWLESVPEQPGAYRWLDGVDRGFTKQHPIVYPQVLADVIEKGWAQEGLAALPVGGVR